MIAKSLTRQEWEFIIELIEKSEGFDKIPQWKDLAAELRETLGMVSIESEKLNL